MTGFPGFIARAIMKKWMRNDKHIDRVTLLVEPHLAELAQKELNELANEEHNSCEWFSIVHGDITETNLGIDAAINQDIQRSVTHVIHLAAIYDLAVSKELAYRVNVIGTEKVNEWAKTLPNLKRYIYFSTAFVSGNREGRIFENELDKHQGFKNHYEETKFEAEKRVREVMTDLPTTIIRPGIVVGDSKTGETSKFDGPYFMLNVFDRLRSLPFIPYIGLGRAEGNFVPVDYLVDATTFFIHADVAISKTYHLTDPSPYKMKDVYHMLMRSYLGKKPFGIVPVFSVNGIMSFSSIRRWLNIEKEVLAYFSCKAQFDCSQTIQDLQGSGISCPDLAHTLDTMATFYEQHKDDEDKQIKVK
nr:SDR family oxidoreductase [Texcoconibacillus texcoconensis]